MMPDGREAMVLGKGIGFGKRPGQTVDEKLIEKVYYVQTEMQTRFLQEEASSCTPSGLEIRMDELEARLDHVESRLAALDGGLG